MAFGTVVVLGEIDRVRPVPLEVDDARDRTTEIVRGHAPHCLLVDHHLVTSGEILELDLKVVSDFGLRIALYLLLLLLSWNGRHQQSGQYFNSG